MSAFHHALLTLTPIRFLLVVMGSYKQIRNQSFPVLKEVKEDNFDHAFDMIRPSMERALLPSFSWLIFAFLVIQGVSDVDRNVTENELQRTMDFVAHVMLTRTNPEMVESVKARLPESLLSSQDILLEDDIDKLIAPGDDEARFVLRELNARKPIHSMYNGPVNMSNETVNGYIGVVKQGFLGMALGKTAE
jgi:flavine halogenase